MLNMNSGAEYSFDYLSKDGVPSKRTILFTGLTVNTAKSAVYVRGYDVEKKEYRTFSVDNIDVTSVKHVRG